MHSHEKDVAKFILLCEPLKKLNIDDFIYFKIYHTGEVISFAKKKKLTQQYFETHYNNYQKYLKNTAHISLNSFIGELVTNNSTNNTIEDELPCHSFIIYEYAEDNFQCYVFNFLTNPSVLEFVNRCQLLKPYFYRYISFFKNEFNLILKRISKNSECVIAIHPVVIEIIIHQDRIDQFLEDTDVKNLPISKKNGDVILLSPKQSLLISLFAKGLSYAEIEDQFNIKRKAAELYFTHIKAKTGYKNRQEIIKAFTRHNMWLK